MLHKHIDAESFMDATRREERRGSVRGNPGVHSMAYGSRYATAEIPKYHLPEKSSSSQVAYQLVHDELEMDGRPAMNLASFVHTWMEPEADRLIMENINKNLSDQDEYPATMRIHSWCVSILANLWKAPTQGNKSVGTATAGSSEAVMLGGLAMKKMWQAKRKREGKDASKPNIVFGNNAQVALEKFARYFDVEARLVPVTASSRYCLDVKRAITLVDENTIGVYLILGSTYTGHFEDVEGMAKELDRLQEERGLDVPIHVDAASGGFVAPFAFPDYKWSFEIPRVVSINSSGHKFGLTYAGIGWILWRSESHLPKELIFELHYLGGTEQTYTLNFSRPACFMIAQYYNFVRLGAEGYRSIMENDLLNARLLSHALEKSGYYDVLSDVHRPKGVTFAGKNEQGKKPKGDGKAADYNASLPVVTFRLNEEFRKENPHVKQAAVSGLLRTRGWIVPNYNLPPDCAETDILRVVVRESMSEDLIDRLASDIFWVTETLMNSESIDSAIFSQTAGSLPESKLQEESVKTNTYARQC
ncbi:glutamate decarboxylase [Jimgerdemannia flammicorona]|uniref:Glutamate decarboxylase n=2 Tax=Jimgerdemannia flammicorona TaxID=994334 RepID=A0A433QXV9_9FUNG|nr:glutamate decarboxylase [Jimgerdemannia flammicorona]RUS34596.1 hypothetical protein BC938DRAFT_479574 [Jimgerdemannia flammicorona]